MLIATMAALFLAFIISIPPLMVHTFITGRQKIGNAEVSAIRFLIAHERAAVRAIWIPWGLGGAIALPVALLSWMRGK